VGVDVYARSAEASRIVQARLPICAAIITQFVTHSGVTSHPARVPLASAGVSAHRRRWTRSLENPRPTVLRLRTLALALDRWIGGRAPEVKGECVSPTWERCHGTSRRLAVA
jgi:hypothetical protein